MSQVLSMVDDNLCAVTDGSDGVIVAWSDQRNVHAARIDSSGNQRWLTMICDETNDQVQPASANDGLGGAIVTWMDSRALQ